MQAIPNNVVLVLHGFELYKNGTVLCVPTVVFTQDPCLDFTYFHYMHFSMSEELI